MKAFADATNNTAQSIIPHTTKHARVKIELSEPKANGKIISSPTKTYIIRA